MTGVTAVEIPVATYQSNTNAFSYTVPTDRYAIVRGSCIKGSQIKINTKVVLNSGSTDGTNSGSFKCIEGDVVTLNSSSTDAGVHIEEYKVPGART